MAVVRPSTPRAFLELAGPLLAENEAAHCLLYGLSSTAMEHPSVYPEIALWVAVRDDRPVAAALRTPPFNVALADPVDDDALFELLDAVGGDQPELPGVVGNVPFVHAAAQRLTGRAGARAEIVLSERVHELTGVLEIPPAPGEARAATVADRALVVRWLDEFLAEAVPHQPRERAGIERTADGRLSAEDEGLWLWEADGRPVCLAGFAGPTPTGVRVGPVYTPPEHRRRGYATALVAQMSRWLLDRGRRACFLYTDLANPTSNAIYGRIGYRPVCDAVEYRFSRG